uniref:ADP-ribosylation factor-like protein 6 n=1 Tax=Ascaris lumbricoides TaxID=6252 RepID=A0A9J2PU74_ASCLU
MGLLNQLTSIFGMSKKQVNILVIGLDNSGKTTILNQLKPPEAQTTQDPEENPQLDFTNEIHLQVVPTVGYNVDKFTSSNMSFSAYDMSGQGKYRNLWETYYKEVDGVIFVVDSSDRLRIAVARDELWLLLDHKEMATRKIPLLVFANKMDEKGSLNASEVSQCLGLDLIRSRNWHICASCALTGQGLVSGMEWFAQNIRIYFETRK